MDNSLEQQQQKSNTQSIFVSLTHRASLITFLPSMRPWMSHQHHPNLDELWKGLSLLDTPLTEVLEEAVKQYTNHQALWWGGCLGDEYQTV